ncbi:hypothetical protein PAPYR_9776 [Paratrimastix pyriformis]|uniref:YTH domain-containing protein n=1 Tax=Paratrimastix pyriformis TaxID=342808 RepID=A0ABQ8UBP3_9EUKA|nr:hypothetical protein PAPYR_9776 [Paratrimastix pyriformis]
MPRYFLLKCREYPVLRASFDSKIWRLPLHKKPPFPSEILNSAFDEGDVFLIASVNGTRAYQGYAKMLEKVDVSPDSANTVRRGDLILSAPFAVEWVATYPGNMGLELPGNTGPRSGGQAPAKPTPSNSGLVATIPWGRSHPGLVSRARGNPYEAFVVSLLQRECPPGCEPAALERLMRFCGCPNVEEVPAPGAAEGAQICAIIGRQAAFLREYQRHREQDPRGDELFVLQTPGGSPAPAGDPVAPQGPPGASPPGRAGSPTGGHERQHEETWEAFLAEVRKVGRVLYAGHTGSRLYNLHGPASDADMLVIVALPPAKLLEAGLGPLLASMKNRNSFKPDYTLHELGRALGLLVEGDPRILEALHADPATVVARSPEWDRLAARFGPRFLAGRFARKYLAEVTGPDGLKKALRFRGQPSTTAALAKAWYVCRRQLGHAEMLARGLPLAPLPPARARPGRAPAGEGGPGAFDENLAFITAKVAEVEGLLAAPDCPIPEEASPETLSELAAFLAEVRRADLAAHLQAAPALWPAHRWPSLRPGCPFMETLGPCPPPEGPGPRTGVAEGPAAWWAPLLPVPLERCLFVCWAPALPRRPAPPADGAAAGAEGPAGTLLFGYVAPWGSVLAAPWEPHRQPPPVLAGRAGGVELAGYEAGRLVELLLAGNPRLWECLLCPCPCPPAMGESAPPGDGGGWCPGCGYRPWDWSRCALQPCYRSPPWRSLMEQWPRLVTVKSLNAVYRALDFAFQLHIRRLTRPGQHPLPPAPPHRTKEQRTEARAAAAKARSAGPTGRPPTPDAPAAAEVPGRANPAEQPDPLPSEEGPTDGDGRLAPRWYTLTNTLRAHVALLAWLRETATGSPADARPPPPGMGKYVHSQPAAPALLPEGCCPCERALYERFLVPLGQARACWPQWLEHLQHIVTPGASQNWLREWFAECRSWFWRRL